MQVGLFLVLLAMSTLVYATTIFHLRGRWMKQFRLDVWDLRFCLWRSLSPLPPMLTVSYNYFCLSFLCLSRCAVFAVLESGGCKD